MFLALFLFTSCFSLLVAAQPKIRVGFFEFYGYHQLDEEGLRSGYGYEFIQRIKHYTNWKYDYIGFDRTWAEMQLMLEDGEIDLLTSAQKTPSREELFDFSEKPIGYSSTILTVKAGNEDYAAGDYASYDGIRVGMVEGSTRNDSFDRFASAHGFAYSRVYFDDLQSMSDALQEGSAIDAIVTSTLRKIENEWILDQFDASPFYVIVKKGNSELIDLVNEAIDHLDMESPEWREELREKYYTPENGDQISFSAEEREYLNDLKTSGHVFTVAVNPDRKPYSYLDEDGNPAGVFISAFERLMNGLSIPFEFLSTKDRNEYVPAVDSGQADIWLDAYYDFSFAEQRGYELASPFLKTGIARISRSGGGGGDGTIAAPKKADITREFLRMNFSEESITYYDSIEECIQAVKDGAAESCYCYVYTAQEAVLSDPRQKLEFSLLPDAFISFAFGIEENQDGRLVSILDKTVPVFKQYIDSMIIDSTTRTEKHVSIPSFIYANPVLSIMIIIVFCSMLFLSILLVAKIRSGLKQQRTDKELARFTGYVCQANDKVMEFNLISGEYKLYEWKDGVVVSKCGGFDFLDNIDHDERIFPDDAGKIKKLFNQDQLMKMMGDGSDVYFEARWRPDPNADYQWYSFSIQPVPLDNEHPDNFILFRRNINEAKQQEQRHTQALKDALATARQASTAKGMFLSRMSHEIRTPLNAVIGYLNVALMSPDDHEKTMHCLENCELAAKHLLSIINQVLDISAIESGKIKIERADFNLKTLISTITSVFYNQAKSKDIRFEVKVESLCDEWVIGDQLRVRQILMNLLSNAIKFTPDGGNVSLTVSQSQRNEDDGVYLRFVVEDDGIGMSKEYLGRLFSPFEQESASTAKQFGGTGLGLSITKNLVTMMGGAIDVESEKGKGTSFIVQMKFGRSNENEKPHELPRNFESLRALVVDDEQSSCDYIKKLLKQCGVKSDMVTSGAAALKQIQRRLLTDHPYDLCIMDWNMPGLDGIETARQIRQETSVSMPIIIATAYDASDISDSAKEAGVSKIISKPLFYSTMFDLLVDSFGKYQPASSEKQMPDVSLSGCRVLLAEDNAMNMEIAKEILEHSGLIVDGAENGQIAVNMFLSARPCEYAAILMDIQMPVMDGYSAAKAIRSSTSPEASTIPIIAMTANAFTEDVAMALASGMNDHIGKPIDYDKLFNVLKKYIGR